MATNRPEPGDFLDMAQRMLRELFGDRGDQHDDDPRGDEDPWAAATRHDRGSSARERYREPSPEQQRENLTFALATRAVEALEDLALTWRRSASAWNARLRSRPPTDSEDD